MSIYPYVFCWSPFSFLPKWKVNKKILKNHTTSKLELWGVKALLKALMKPYGENKN